jgi:hypothetical protein
VAGDYLRQLQLTKQLEQKTKEAAKNRKEAEESMAEAEKAIASAKAFDAGAAEAEKALFEASQAFQQKDYKLALSLATKSIGSSESSRRGKVDSIISSGESLLKLFSDKDVPKELQASARKARALLEEGKMDEALARSRELWDAVERFVNSRVADMFGNAQSLLLLAERLKVGTEGERQMLVQARKKLEEGDYGASIAQLKDCLETSSAGLRNAFGSRVEAVNGLTEQGKEVGIDFTKVEETLSKARALTEKGNFEGAFSNLGIAESEARTNVSRGLQVRFDGLKQRAIVLKGYEVNVNETIAGIAKGKELARADRAEEAIDAWHELEGSLRDLEAEETLILVGRLRSKLLIAKKTKTDISKVIVLLDQSRITLNQGDFQGAALQIAEADKALEKALEGYREVEENFLRTKALFKTATVLKVDLREPKKKVELARQLVMKQDFKQAIEQLKAAQDDTHRGIQANLGEDIMRAEMKVTQALKVGADITAESALLEDIVARTKRGEYEGIKEAIDTCIHDADHRIYGIAERTLYEAKNLLDIYTGPVNISTHRNMLYQANEALREGQALHAYELAMASTEAIKRDEKSVLDERLNEAKHLLSIARDIGSVSVTLNDKLNKAEELRSQFEIHEALRLVSDVLTYSRSIIKDELTRQLALLTRGISTARKNGIEVLQAERLSEEASRAVGRGELDKGYALWREGEITLERLIAVHTRIYDRLVEITAMLKEAEAQSLDVSKQATMLSNAKRLYEAGRYEEALPAIAKTFVETEKMVAPFMAPRKAQGARDLLAVAKRLGFDVGAPQKRLEGAERLIEKKEYATAMISIREVEKTVMSILINGAEKELEQVKDLLLRAKEAGSEVTSAQQILVKAESLLNEKRVYDALRAIDLAKSELDQSLLMSEKAQDTMEKAKSTISDAQEFGVNVDSAIELLRQARSYNKLGRHGIAHELAKKASDQASSAAGDMVHDRLRKVEGDYLSAGLEGQDMEAALRIKADIASRLEARKFREAAALLKGLEEELENVKAQKELSARSLQEMEAKVNEAKDKGLINEKIDSLLTQAQESYRSGGFIESYALAARCGDELRGLVNLYDRRRAELEELRQEARSLEGEDAGTAVTEMAEAARNSIGRLDFEAATLYLRRGKAAAQEARTKIAGERLKNLENMVALAEEMKIDRGSLPHVALKTLEAKKEGRPLDLKELRESVDAMATVLSGQIERRFATVEESVAVAQGSGADVSASMDLLLKAKGLLKQGKYRGAANSVQEAERSIGMAVEEQRHFVESRVKVEAKIEHARRSGLELTETIALFKEAEHLKEKDHRAAQARMDKALEAANQAAEQFLPDIQVDLNFLDALKLDTWTRAQLHLANDAKAMAREVQVRISGDMEARGFEVLPKLRGGERLSLDIEVKALAQGTAHVKLALECRPVLSNDPVGYDSEFDVEVV